MREPRSAQEIQAEVSRLIHASRDVADARATVDVPLPARLPEAGPGDCNWSMDYFGNAIPFMAAVESAVADVASRWNLR